MRTLLTGADGATLSTTDSATSIQTQLAQAYPWPEGGPWTRVAMLRALDGGVAGPDGRSRSISSEQDRAVLGEIRRLSDAIVVGASTMRQEPYGPLVAPPDAKEPRRHLGLAAAPVLVVVSASLDLPWDAPVFTESDRTPLVVTGAPDRADPERLRRAREHADVIAIDSTQIRASDIVRALHERGLRRLVCEGGPGLLASFAAEDLVDEVDLTLSPLLATQGNGPGHPALAAGPHRFELAHLLLHESFLFAKYLRVGSGEAGPH